MDSQPDNIIRLPAQRSAVWLLRDGDGWLALVGSYGWLHSSSAAALEDARWLSANHSLPIRIGGNLLNGAGS